MASNGLVTQAVGKPMSVQEITQKAEDFQYNPQVPLRYWLRTAETLLKEAEIYEREGNDEQAYLLLFRHARLVLDHLCKHRDGQKPENRTALEAAARMLPKTMLRLEKLKPRITRRHDAYRRLAQERETRRAATAQAQGMPVNQLLRRERAESDTRPTSDPALEGEARPLAAADNRDLAVKIAHTEIRRRETARKATRQAGISAAEEHERRTAGLWGDWERELAQDGGAGDIEQDELQRRMQATRTHLDEPARSASRGGSNRRSSITGADYRYPTVPKREQSSMLLPLLPEKTPTRHTARLSLPPQPPPKPPAPGTAEKAFPPRPAKDALSTPEADPAPNGPNSSSFAFKPSAYLENGTPLRTLFLPPDLRSRFLTIAYPNTSANLETCGILCGTLISNALFVSRLVIPDQRSTSDTCETVNEDALFAFCDAEDLMVLGWIHTHPSQRCFMSSRDLHTHSGYQVMMPESIAIVCAPSQTPSWGVFRLTDPPGMKAVLNCRQPGLFHPHEETHLYTDALRPGHVFEASGLEFQVADLRPGH
ncbi:MAG: hypothetical protein M1832_000677 [Thelocarpon impressellum]|nr:MAG: hypothetical protein M1832_000677 [Thelocarpon impressellum]